MTRYISTRGQAPALSFEEVVLAGLASDGGLYVPETIPVFSPAALAAMKPLSYTELAFKVMQPFIGNAIPEKELKKILEETYKTFRHEDVTPLKKLRENEFLLELFHGPTLAFKDVALQFLGRILEYFITKRGEELTIIGATSGDTGSAAIEGCRGRKHMRIFILYPDGRVSDVQRRQMTTLAEDNVFNLAVKGTFDDCQDIVKELFNDKAFRTTCKLTAVNSINWARILAQVVYYFYAAFTLGSPERSISFSVPTGNFGDIYAGYIAKKMGLPIEKLIIATNRNDILTRVLETGKHTPLGVTPSLSPSMDIQISSNFERVLFDLYDHDAKAITDLLKPENKRTFALSDKVYERLRETFAAGRADDSQIQATIKQVYDETGELIDPHTAVGVKVGRECHKGASPLVILATAHPAKFPDTVEKATGIHPPLPAHLSDLMTRKERVHNMTADARAVRSFIEAHS